MNSSTNLNKFIKMALLAAIAVVLMFISFPIIPLFPWLKIDLSELPVLMGAFAFGPMAGVIIEGMKILLNLLITGTNTGFVGELANFIVGVSFVLPASYIYHRNKNKKTAILGMIAGALVMQVVAIISNVYFLLPAYGMHLNGAEAIKYVTVGLLPFNGIKAFVVSVITFLIYKRISIAVFKEDSGFSTNKKLEEAK